MDDGSNLRLTSNVSIVFKGTPTAATGRHCGHIRGNIWRNCGFSTPDQSIIRTSDDRLLMGLYGYMADGFKNGTLCTCTQLPHTIATFADHCKDTQTRTFL